MVELLIKTQKLLWCVSPLEEWTTQLTIADNYRKCNFNESWSNNLGCLIGPLWCIFLRYCLWLETVTSQESEPVSDAQHLLCQALKIFHALSLPCRMRLNTVYQRMQKDRITTWPHLLANVCWHNGAAAPQKRLSCAEQRKSERKATGETLLASQLASLLLIDTRQCASC